MQDLRNKNAFSLIELSIVILIIGFISSGIFGGKVLVENARLKRVVNYSKSFQIKWTIDIPQPVLWLNSTDESSVTLDSSNQVSTWYDKSRMNNNAAQSVSGKYPIYTEEAINNLAAIRFDGVNDALSIPHNIDFNVDDEFTIVLVYRQDSSHTGAANIIQKGGNWFSIGPYITDGFINLGKAGVAYLKTDIDANEGKASVLLWSKNGSSSYISLNGTDISTPFTDATIVNNSNNLVIGSNSTQSAGFFTGDIGEIILFDEALASDEIDIVESYLLGKWGV